MNTEEWRRITELHASGESIRQIAAAMGISRNTVRRALGAETPPQDRRATRGSYFDVYADDIRRALRSAPEATVAELATLLSWPLSHSALAKYVARVRKETGATGATGATGRQETRETREILAGAPGGPIANADPREGLPERRLPAPTHTPGLPRYATDFVGRRADTAALRDLLRTQRLVTITGPGGVGKTRLAVHTAQAVRRAYPDGVRFVELASLRSPQLLAETVLDALGLAGGHQLSGSAESALVDHLQHRRMLLVLDNGEHLIDSCATLAHSLLQQTRNLTIIVTSREVLAVPEEFAFVLAPLPVDAAEGENAISLFVSRATGVLGGFELDARNREAAQRVCAGLDGLPLAIELACARLPVLSVHELADRLDRRLELLTTGNRGAPERHRSLGATLAWSHDHCTPEQQRLWARASVFVDGFDLAMAERVCADELLPAGRILDAIAALVAKSILVREETGAGVRFRMLETVREFGQQHLVPGEVEALVQRLMTWTRATMVALTRNWMGPGQIDAIQRVRANRSNLRTCLQTALDAPVHEPRFVMADAIADPWFLWCGGLSVREHRLWLTRLADTLPPSRTRGRVIATLALVQTLQGDRGAAMVSVAAVRALTEEFDDSATHDFAIHTEGLAHYFAGDFERAEPLLLEAYDRYRLREPRGGLQGALDVHLGMHFAVTGHLERATLHFDTSHTAAARCGDRWLGAYATFGQGLVALLSGDAGQARAHAVAGLRNLRDFDDTIGTTLLTDLLSWAEADGGDAERSAVLLGSALQQWGAVGQQLYGSDHWMLTRERYAGIARDRLGDASYRELGRRGAALSADELVDYALGEAPSTPSAPTPTPRRTSGRIAAPVLPSLDGAPALTAREAEVAGLVAAGMTNKEIAAQLVLSPRTVEGHVEHALRKLGLERRGQIAALMSATQAGPQTP